MANHKNIIPFIKQREAGLSRDTRDKASSYPCPTPYKGVYGYHTNKGFTYKTWVSFFGTNQDARFFAMSDADWSYMFKKGYWDFFNGDAIKNQAVADFIADWTFGSYANATKNVQQVLTRAPFNYSLLQLGITGKNFDGIIGPKSLGCINVVDAKVLLEKLHFEKLDYYEQIVKEDATQKAFIDGWIDRAEKLYTLTLSYVLKKKV